MALILEKLATLMSKEQNVLLLNTYRLDTYETRDKKQQFKKEGVMENVEWCEMPWLIKLYVYVTCIIITTAVANMIAQTFLFITVSKWIGTL